MVNYLFDSSNSKKGSNFYLPTIICLMIFLPYICFHVTSVLSVLHISGNFTIIFYGITYLAAIFCVLFSITRINISIAISLYILIIMIFYSFVVSPGAISLKISSIRDLPYSNTYRLFIQSMPIFFAVLSFRNDEKKALAKCLFIFSIANIVVSILDFLFVRVIFADDYSSSSFYMSFAYDTLFSYFVLYFFAKKNNRIIIHLISIFSLITIIIGGSRGSIFAVLVFLVLYHLIYEKNIKKRICFIILLLFFTIIFLFFLT